MRSILFEIPGLGLPVYGFGAMLVIALLLCPRVAARAAAREGGNPDQIYDLAFWLFLWGILGGRAFYFVQHNEQFDHWWQFFILWRGGLVVYGAAISALVAFLVYCHRHHLPKLWLLDVIAPSIALGMAFGRIGCLLNGCCYGGYCEQPWAVRFPPNSPVHRRMVERGDQSPLGFGLSRTGPEVAFVEPQSPAEQHGLRPGDRVRSFEGVPVHNDLQLLAALNKKEQLQQRWVTSFTVMVEKNDGHAEQSMMLAPAWSLPVHPTQAYSSINGFVLFLLLSAYLPLRRHTGQVIAGLAILYSIWRFLIECLRIDEQPVLYGMTISQSLSVLLLVAGIGVWLYCCRQPARCEAAGILPAKGTASV